MKIEQVCCVCCVCYFLCQVQPNTPSTPVPVMPKNPMTRLDLPVFAFVWKNTTSGWPHTRPWLTTLASIMATGYDAARTDPVLFASPVAREAAVAEGEVAQVSHVRGVSLPVKKGLTRLTCCGWLLMHAVKAESELPEDVTTLIRSMQSVSSTFSPSKGAAQDTYETIFVTNRAAMRQRTTSLKLCTMFANTIDVRDQQDKEERKKLSDAQKLELEYEGYNNYDGVAGVVDHQLSRDEKDTVTNVYCYTSARVRARLSCHLNMFYEKDSGFNREMLRSRNWTVGFKATLEDDLSEVAKYFSVSEESQVMHISMHCDDFEKRAGKMKAGRRPQLPGKDAWARQAMECAMFAPLLELWSWS